VAICPSLTWHADFPDGETMLAPTFAGASIQARNTANWSQLDNPQVNGKMASASVVTGQTDRADAWGGVDRDVAARAPAVPWLWDRAINLRSANVKGVVNLVRSGWDLAFCSLR
jgi:peptide/nickel transport system substrate-binding protein